MSVKEFTVNLINKHMASGNPIADKLVMDLFTKLKHRTYRHFSKIAKDFMDLEQFPKEDRTKNLTKLNDAINVLEAIFEGIEPRRLLSTFLLALNAELLAPGNGKNLLQSNPDLNGHELGLVFKYCASYKWEGIGSEFITNLGNLLNKSCNRLFNENMSEFLSVKNFFAKLTSAQVEEVQENLLGSLICNPSFSKENPILDSSISLPNLNVKDIEERLLKIGGKCVTLLENVEKEVKKASDSFNDSVTRSIIRDSTIKYREILNEYNCTIMAIQGKNSLQFESLLYYMKYELLEKDGLIELKKFCVSEPIIELGSFKEIKKRIQAEINNGSNFKKSFLHEKFLEIHPMINSLRPPFQDGRGYPELKGDDLLKWIKKFNFEGLPSQEIQDFFHVPYNIIETVIKLLFLPDTSKSRKWIIKEEYDPDFLAKKGKNCWIAEDPASGRISKWTVDQGKYIIKKFLKRYGFRYNEKAGTFYFIKPTQRIFLDCTYIIPNYGSKAFRNAYFPLFDGDETLYNQFIEIGRHSGLISTLSTMDPLNMFGDLNEDNQWVKTEGKRTGFLILSNGGQGERETACCYCGKMPKKHAEIQKIIPHDINGLVYGGKFISKTISNYKADGFLKNSKKDKDSEVFNAIIALNDKLKVDINYDNQFDDIVTSIANDIITFTRDISPNKELGGQQPLKGILFNITRDALHKRRGGEGYYLDRALKILAVTKDADFNLLKNKLKANQFTGYKNKLLKYDYNTRILTLQPADGVFLQLRLNTRFFEGNINFAIRKKCRNWLFDIKVGEGSYDPVTSKINWSHVCVDSGLEDFDSHELENNDEISIGKEKIFFTMNFYCHFQEHYNHFSEELYNKMTSNLIDNIDINNISPSTFINLIPLEKKYERSSGIHKKLWTLMDSANHQFTSQKTSDISVAFRLIEELLLLENQSKETGEFPLISQQSFVKKHGFDLSAMTRINNTYSVIEEKFHFPSMGDFAHRIITLKTDNQNLAEGKKRLDEIRMEYKSLLKKMEKKADILVNAKKWFTPSLFEKTMSKSWNRGPFRLDDDVIKYIEKMISNIFRIINNPHLNQNRPKFKIEMEKLTKIFHKAKNNAKKIEKDDWLLLSKDRKITKLAQDCLVQIHSIFKSMFDGLIPSSFFDLNSDNSMDYREFNGKFWKDRNGQLIYRKYKKIEVLSQLIALDLGFPGLFEWIESKLPFVSQQNRFDEHCFKNYFKGIKIVEKPIDGYHYFEIQYEGSNFDEYRFIGRFKKDSPIDLMNNEEKMFQIIKRSKDESYSLKEIVKLAKSKMLEKKYTLIEPVVNLIELL
ncbi:MAG: hypothetical protein ACFFCS_04240 [Candidatus Hodarchaeota archaeon]